MLSRTLLVFAAALAALIAANGTAAHSQPDGDVESARRATGSTAITQRVETGTPFGQYTADKAPAAPGCFLPYIFGNVWDDREVNEMDALWLLRKIAGFLLPGGGVPCGPMDINCDGKNDTLDALQILRWVAGLPTNQQEGCMEIGTPFGLYSGIGREGWHAQQQPAGIPCGLPLVFGNLWDGGGTHVDSKDALWLLRKIAGLPLPGGGVGCSPHDIDCDGDVDAVDALQILRWVAGLPTNQEEGCPEIGTPYGPYS